MGVYFLVLMLVGKVGLVWFGMRWGLTAGDENFDEELVLARLWDLTVPEGQWFACSVEEEGALLRHCCCCRCRVEDRV